MIASKVTRRYASALFSVAVRADAVDKIADDLALIRRTVQEAPALKSALVEGVVPEDACKRVLQRLFEHHVHPVTLEFLYLLVDKRREEVISGIDVVFRQIADEKRGIQRALLTSSVPLSDQEILSARSALEKLTGKKIEIDRKVDPGIIGGLIVRVGDRVFDGSVTGQLNQIRKALAGVR